MNPKNNVKIDKAEIELKTKIISSHKGIATVSSTIDDDSTIYAWKKLKDDCNEVDIIRKRLCESEDLLVENIEILNKLWFDLDKTVAKNI